MIEIKHRNSGEVLYTVEADTLRGADLNGLYLPDADFRSADLRGADLGAVNLTNADLSYAVLYKASLVGSVLNSANLTGAVLSNADCTGAVFFKSDLTETNMGFADLSHTRLAHANLSRTVLGGTLFIACTNLHLATGFESIEHRGPSVMDVRTLRDCINALPDVFLLGMGYNQLEVNALRKMYTIDKEDCGINYYSCFLSHGSNDLAFAERLHTDLLSQSVICWHHRHDLQGGDYWRSQVNAAIRQRDKLIVVCSEDGLLRANVVDEILEGMEQERDSGTQKLFPIRLDDFILSKEMEQVIADRLPLQQRENWTRYLRQYHIPDFSRWKEHDAYQMEFAKLLNALKYPQQR